MSKKEDMLSLVMRLKISQMSVAVLICLSEVQDLLAVLRQCIDDAEITPNEAILVTRYLARSLHSIAANKLIYE